RVIKDYEKYKAFQKSMKDWVDYYQKEEKKKRTDIETLKAKLAPPATSSSEEKDKIIKDITAIERSIQDMGEEAKQKLGTASDAQMVALYREIRDVAARYADAHNFDLVLHYNDAAVEDKEFYGAPNVARKIQAGACMPLYWKADMDISGPVVD